MTDATKTALIERTNNKATHEITTADLLLLIEIQTSDVARSSLFANYRDRVAIRDLSDADPVGLYADDFA